MRADLDLLCISVYCTADDLLPARPGNVHLNHHLGRPSRAIANYSA